MRSKLCLAAALTVLSAVWARAEPVSQLQPTGYVNDFAHVLDADTIAQLDNICQQINQKAHAQIAVVTVKTVDAAKDGTTPTIE